MLSPPSGVKAFLATLCITASACALSSAAAQAPVARPDSGLFRRHDADFLRSAVAVAAVVSLFDGHVASEVMEPGGKNSAMGHVSTFGGVIGGAGPIAFSTVLYAAGRITHRPGLTSLGKQSVEALVLSGTATGLLKGLVGRERPYAADGNIDVYRPGRGFGNSAFASFPSGHTSAAFAVATVLAQGSAHASPNTHRAVALLSYGAATAVGISRLYANMHWTSDVIAGAALGVTSGLIVARHARRHEPERSASSSSFGIGDLISRTSITQLANHRYMIAFSAR